MTTGILKSILALHVVAIEFSKKITAVQVQRTSCIVMQFNRR